MIARYFPALTWLRAYQRENFSHDFSAGLTVAIMLVPQGMAYAMLAGLPPVIGLYACTLPLIVYALFGTSRQLAVGPVAMVSLLVSVGVEQLADPGSQEYISFVLLLTVMTGFLQLLLGLLRMGFVVNFLSHAVISGFTSAAALVIGLSQLKHLLGVRLENQHNVLLLLLEAVQKLPETSLLTFLIGLISIIILIWFKKKFPRFPAPLVVVFLGALVVFAFHLERSGVKIVGEVPQGIPRPSLPTFSLASLEALLPAAVTIVFVGFMESFAVAQSIATKEKYKVDANQELIGLGAANLVSALFSGYTVTGGFSRTAVNYQAGAKTGLAAIITAIFIILTLLFFTSLFYYLPNAVLAAIVMVAVSGLINVREFRRLFHLKPVDGWTLVLTFACTLLLGIEIGIVIGVMFSLFVFIWRSSHPHIAELGYVESEDVYLNVKRFPHAKAIPHALLLRVDASLFFANTRFLENYLRAKIVDANDLRYIILDLSGVNDVDAVALHALHELVHEFRAQGIEFAFAGMKGPVRDLFKKAGWEEQCGHTVEYHTLAQVLEELDLQPK